MVFVFCLGITPLELGLKSGLSEGLRWGRGVSSKGYLFQKKRGSILGRQKQWMSACVLFHRWMEWWTKVGWLFNTRDTESGYNSHFWIMLIVKLYFFMLLLQPARRLHSFFVSLEIRLSWNRWIGKSLCYTENIVAVTVVAIETVGNESGSREKKQ